MRRFFRILLAGIYITTTFAVITGQAEAAGDELSRARSAASPWQSDSDTHWASDPHFSHAKKTGSDIELSFPSLLCFVLTAFWNVQHTIRSAFQVFQVPKLARAPPLLF